MDATSTQQRNGSGEVEDKTAYALACEIDWLMCPIDGIAEMRKRGKTWTEIHNALARYLDDSGPDDIVGGLLWVVADRNGELVDNSVDEIVTTPSRLAEWADRALWSNPSHGREPDEDLGRFAPMASKLVQWAKASRAGDVAEALADMERRAAEGIANLLIEERAGVREPQPRDVDGK